MISTKTEGAAKGKALALGCLVGALMAALLLLTAEPAHPVTTFTVNSTGDQSDADLVDDPNVCDTDLIAPRNQCTLRAAIEEANHTDGADAINFNIDPSFNPGCDSTSKVCTITLTTTMLPDITERLTIDGYSQGKLTADPADDAKPATSTNKAVLKIQLRSVDPFTALANGIKITAANSTVKGLVINVFQAGVRIEGSGATGNKVQGNYIGTNASGTQKLGNGDGVVIQSAPNNTVGGTNVGARNVISGSSSEGIAIVGTGATGNKVRGNYIGTDASGTQTLRNGRGVGIIDAPNNTVGGTDADDGAVDGVVKARNIISGNGGGVSIQQASATGNKVQGNYIGTNASGTQKLGNGGGGVGIIDASTNTIGGTTAGARNIISGNGLGGVLISSFGGSAENNKIEGNYIGTDKNGTADLGNSEGGVHILSAATGSPATNNFVGGTASGASNVIAFNGRDGVELSGGKTTGNRILSNSIHSNLGLGIDLLGLGESEVSDIMTVNDDKDPDGGPNDLQNKPKITSAKPTTVGTTKVTKIKGTLNSTPSQTFTIQLFRDQPGEDQGRTLLRQFPSITTDANGNANFSTSVMRSAAPVGFAITATAMNNSTGTSEFSKACTVLATVPCPP